MSGRAWRHAELGQRFLAGGRLAAELVEQAGVGAGDLVLEIGAGSGVLTEAKLPFGSTAAILRRLLGDPLIRLERADLVVQEQAARRDAAARPATPETVVWGAWYQLGTGRRLPPSRSAAAPQPGPAAQLPAAAPPGRRPELPAGRRPGRPRRGPVGRAVRVPAWPAWEDQVRARRIGRKLCLLTAAEGDRWGR